MGPRPSLPQPPFALHPAMMAGAGTLFAVGNLAAVRICILAPRNESPQVWPVWSLSQWTSPLEAVPINCPAGFLGAILLQHCFLKDLLLRCIQRVLALLGLIFWIIVQWYTPAFVSQCHWAEPKDRTQIYWLVPLVTKSLGLGVKQWVQILALQAIWIMGQINLSQLVVVRMKGDNVCRV